MATKLKIVNRYGVIPNDILNHAELTFKAKGLFGYLQSKPESWEFSVSRIARQTKDGREAIRSALLELETFGLLSRRPVKNVSGQFAGHEYILTDKPLSENPSSVFPSSENHVTISNKDVSKKENSKKELTVANPKGRVFDRVTFPEIFELADNLAVIVKSTKNVKINQRKISAWAAEIRKLITLDGIDIDRIKNALTWYEQNVGGEFVPVILSGQTLRNKFLKLEAAIERSCEANEETKPGTPPWEIHDTPAHTVYVNLCKCKLLPRVEGEFEKLKTLFTADGDLSTQDRDMILAKYSAYFPDGLKIKSEYKTW